MKKLLLGAAALALAAAAPAQAGGLTLIGETGVVRTPQAAALEPKSFQVAGDLTLSEDLSLPLRLEFGVIEGLEVGINYWLSDSRNNWNQWGLNAKYVIPTDLDERLAVAAGLSYQAESADGGYDVSLIKLHGVLSYAVDTRIPILVTGGLSYEVQDGDKNQSGVRLFGSAMADVMPRLVAGAEFVFANEDLDGDDADPGLWFGARYALRDNVLLQGGIMNNANLGGSDPSDFVLHVGGQYSFSLAP